MKNKIKKSLIATTQNKDLNYKIQHKLYRIKKQMSNLSKKYKLKNILSISIIAIYILQNLYHLTLNGLSMNYITGLFATAILYIPLAYMIKIGINE